jgi:hypothetical protein
VAPTIVFRRRRFSGTVLGYYAGFPRRWVVHRQQKRACGADDCLSSALGVISIAMI